MDHRSHYAVCCASIDWERKVTFKAMVKRLKSQLRGPSRRVSWSTDYAARLWNGDWTLNFDYFGGG